jgi:hypothetical protein
MTIVKATYTRKSAGAKASIRYIEHRRGKDGVKKSRILFNSEGALGRWQAYQIIEQAEKGSIFFRFVISPDPKAEDSEKDLHLREVTALTMQALQDRLQKPVLWIAAEHDDHAPHRHIHVVAVVPGRLNVADFQELRKTATSACLQQRQERDLLKEQARTQKAQESEEGLGWEHQQ